MWLNLITRVLNIRNFILSASFGLLFYILLSPVFAGHLGGTGYFCEGSSIVAEFEEDDVHYFVKDCAAERLKCEDGECVGGSGSTGDRSGDEDDDNDSDSQDQNICEPLIDDYYRQCGGRCNGEEFASNETVYVLHYLEDEVCRKDTFKCVSEGIKPGECGNPVEEGEKPQREEGDKCLQVLDYPACFNISGRDKTQVCQVIDNTCEDGFVPLAKPDTCRDAGDGECGYAINSSDNPFQGDQTPSKPTETESERPTDPDVEQERQGTFASSCNQEGGPDPNTGWIFEGFGCDFDNPGNEGQKWFCKGKTKFVHDEPSDKCQIVERHEDHLEGEQMTDEICREMAGPFKRDCIEGKCIQTTYGAYGNACATFAKEVNVGFCPNACRQDSELAERLLKEQEEKEVACRDNASHNYYCDSGYCIDETKTYKNGVCGPDFLKVDLQKCLDVGKDCKQIKDSSGFISANSRCKAEFGEPKYFCNEANNECWVRQGAADDKGVCGEVKGPAPNPQICRDRGLNCGREVSTEEIFAGNILQCKGENPETYYCDGEVCKYKSFTYDLSKGACIPVSPQTVHKSKCAQWNECVGNTVSTGLTTLDDVCLSKNKTEYKCEKEICLAYVYIDKNGTCQKDEPRMADNFYRCNESACKGNTTEQGIRIPGITIPNKFENGDPIKPVSGSQGVPTGPKEGGYCAYNQKCPKPNTSTSDTFQSCYGTYQKDPEGKLSCKYLEGSECSSCQEKEPDLSASNKDNKCELGKCINGPGPLCLTDIDCASTKLGSYCTYPTNQDCASGEKVCSGEINDKGACVYKDSGAGPSCTACSDKPINQRTKDNKCEIQENKGVCVNGPGTRCVTDLDCPQPPPPAPVLRSGEVVLSDGYIYKQIQKCSIQRQAAANAWDPCRENELACDLNVLTHATQKDKEFRTCVLGYESTGVSYSEREQNAVRLILNASNTDGVLKRTQEVRERLADATLSSERAENSLAAEQQEKARREYEYQLKNLQLLVNGPENKPNPENPDSKILEGINQSSTDSELLKLGEERQKQRQELEKAEREVETAINNVRNSSYDLQSAENTDEAERLQAKLEEDKRNAENATVELETLEKKYPSIQTLRQQQAEQNYRVPVPNIDEYNKLTEEQKINLSLAKVNKPSDLLAQSYKKEYENIPTQISIENSQARNQIYYDYFNSLVSLGDKNVDELDDEFNFSKKLAADNIERLRAGNPQIAAELERQNTLNDANSWMLIYDGRLRASGGVVDDENKELDKIAQNVQLRIDEVRKAYGDEKANDIYEKYQATPYVIQTQKAAENYRNTIVRAGKIQSDDDDFAFLSNQNKALEEYNKKIAEVCNISNSSCINLSATYGENGVKIRELADEDRIKALAIRAELEGKLVELGSLSRFEGDDDGRALGLKNNEVTLLINKLGEIDKGLALVYQETRQQTVALGEKQKESDYARASYLSNRGLLLALDTVASGKSAEGFDVEKEKEEANLRIASSLNTLRELDPTTAAVFGNDYLAFSNLSEKDKDQLNGIQGSVNLTCLVASNTNTCDPGTGKIRTIACGNVPNRITTLSTSENSTCEAQARTFRIKQLGLRDDATDEQIAQAANEYTRRVQEEGFDEPSGIAKFGQFIATAAFCSHPINLLSPVCQENRQQSRQFFSGLAEQISADATQTQRYKGSPLLNQECIVNEFKGVNDPRCERDTRSATERSQIVEQGLSSGKSLADALVDAGWNVKGTGDPKLDQDIRKRKERLLAIAKEWDLDGKIQTFEDIESKWSEDERKGFVKALALTDPNLAKAIFEGFAFSITPSQRISIARDLCTEKYGAGCALGGTRTTEQTLASMSDLEIEKLKAQTRILFPNATPLEDKTQLGFYLLTVQNNPLLAINNNITEEEKESRREQLREKLGWSRDQLAQAEDTVKFYNATSNYLLQATLEGRGLTARTNEAMNQFGLDLAFNVLDPSDTAKFLIGGVKAGLVAAGVKSLASVDRPAIQFAETAIQQQLRRSGSVGFDFSSLETRSADRLVTDYTKARDQAGLEANRLITQLARETDPQTRVALQTELDLTKAKVAQAQALLDDAKQLQADALAGVGGRSGVSRAGEYESSLTAYREAIARVESLPTITPDDQLQALRDAAAQAQTNLERTQADLNRRKIEASSKVAQEGGKLRQLQDQLDQTPEAGKAAQQAAIDAQRAYVESLNQAARTEQDLLNQGVERLRVELAQTQNKLKLAERINPDLVQALEERGAAVLRFVEARPVIQKRQAVEVRLPIAEDIIAQTDNQTGLSALEQDLRQKAQKLVAAQADRERVGLEAGFGSGGVIREDVQIAQQALEKAQREFGDALRISDAGEGVAATNKSIRQARSPASEALAITPADPLGSKKILQNAARRQAVEEVIIASDRTAFSVGRRLDSGVDEVTISPRIVTVQEKDEKAFLWVQALESYGDRFATGEGRAVLRGDGLLVDGRVILTPEEVDAIVKGGLIEGTPEYAARFGGDQSARFANQADFDRVVHETASGYLEKQDSVARVIDEVRVPEARPLEPEQPRNVPEPREEPRDQAVPEPKPVIQTTEGMNAEQRAEVWLRVLDETPQERFLAEDPKVLLTREVELDGKVIKLSEDEVDTLINEGLVLGTAKYDPEKFADPSSGRASFVEAVKVASVRFENSGKVVISIPIIGEILLKGKPFEIAASFRASHQTVNGAISAVETITTRIDSGLGRLHPAIRIVLDGLVWWNTGVPGFRQVNGTIGKLIKATNPERLGIEAVPPRPAAQAPEPVKAPKAPSVTTSLVEDIPKDQAIVWTKAGRGDEILSLSSAKSSIPGNTGLIETLPNGDLILKQADRTYLRLRPLDDKRYIEIQRAPATTEGRQALVDQSEQPPLVRITQPTPVPPKPVQQVAVKSDPGSENRLGVSSLQGDRSYQEDRSLTVANFNNRRDQFLVGVFDGHGGSRGSEYASQNFAQTFQANLTGGNISQAFNRTFVQLGDAIQRRVSDGATAVVALRQGDNLTVGWAGDSYAVVGESQKRRSKVVVMTRDHNPKNPAEAARVRNSGGSIDGDGYVKGAGGGVAVSRSLGDRQFKGVIPNPEIESLRINNNHFAGFLASDGLKETVGDQEAINIIRQYWEQGLLSQQAAEHLANLAYKRKSGDNITINVFYLQDPPKAKSVRAAAPCPIGLAPDSIAQANPNILGIQIAQANPCPLPDPDKFFRSLRDKLNTEGGVPGGWQWEPDTSSIGTFYEVRALREGRSYGGYTSEGLDTARTAADYEKTLTTGAPYDSYTKAFGYGVNGQAVEGKKILDVGSGTSLFGPISNFVYGNKGTQVISLDPKYADVVLTDAIQKRTKTLFDDVAFTTAQEPQLVAGFAQKLEFPDKSFNETVSHFGVTLVPIEQFSQSVKEMIRVSSDKVQILPFISFEDIGKLNLPKGVSLKRQSLDGFTFVIDVKSINSADDVVSWIEKNCVEDQRKCQFFSSEDLIHRRHQGFYYKDGLERNRQFLSPTSEERTYLPSNPCQLTSNYLNLASINSNILGKSITTDCSGVVALFTKILYDSNYVPPPIRWINEAADRLSQGRSRDLAEDLVDGADRRLNGFLDYFRSRDPNALSSNDEINELAKLSGFSPQYMEDIYKYDRRTYEFLRNKHLGNPNSLSAQIFNRAQSLSQKVSDFSKESWDNFRAIFEPIPPEAGKEINEIRRRSRLLDQPSVTGLKPIGGGSGEGYDRLIDELSPRRSNTAKAFVELKPIYRNQLGQLKISDEVREILLREFDNGNLDVVFRAAREFLDQTEGNPNLVKTLLKGSVYEGTELETDQAQKKLGELLRGDGGLILRRLDQIQREKGVDPLSWRNQVQEKRWEEVVGNSDGALNDEEKIAELLDKIGSMRGLQRIDTLDDLVRISINDSETAEILLSFIHNERATSIQQLFLDKSPDEIDQFLRIINKVITSNSLTTQGELDSLSRTLSDSPLFYDDHELFNVNPSTGRKILREWIDARKNNPDYALTFRDYVVNRERFLNTASQLLDRISREVEPVIGQELSEIAAKAQVSGADVISVGYRSKELESLVGKLRKKLQLENSPDYSLADVTDLTGGRIIVEDLASFERIMGIIEVYYGAIGRILEKDNKYISTQGTENSYKAAHYLIRVGEEHVYELQINTRLTGIATNLGHDSVYKDLMELPESTKYGISKFIRRINYFELFNYRNQL